MAADESSNNPNSNTPKRAFFRWAGIGWWIIIIFGLSLNYVVAFHPQAVPYEHLSFLGSFLKFVSIYNITLKAIFISAVAIHIGEGWVAWNLCGKLNLRRNDKLKWYVQTTILGFPSLRILVKERQESLRKL